MRLLAAILICIGILGGTAGYMHAVAVRHTNFTYDEPPPAAGVYAVEITPSFEIGVQDPFASNFELQGLSVRLAEKVLFSESVAAAGKPIRIEPIVGLIDGRNELFIKATVSSDQGLRANALRVRVFRDYIELSDQTLWSDSGGEMSGKIAITVEQPQAQEAAHDHD